MLWSKKHSCGEATAADAGTDPITVAIAEAPPADDPMLKFDFGMQRTLKEKGGKKGKEKKRKSD